MDPEEIHGMDPWYAVGCIPSQTQIQRDIYVGCGFAFKLFISMQLGRFDAVAPPVFTFGNASACIIANIHLETIDRMVLAPSYKRYPSSANWTRPPRGSERKKIQHEESSSRNPHFSTVDLGENFLYFYL